MRDRESRDTPWAKLGVLAGVVSALAAVAALTLGSGGGGLAPSTTTPTSSATTSTASTGAKVAATVKTVMTALADDDGATACNNVSPTFAQLDEKQYNAPTCADAVHDFHVASTENGVRWQEMRNAKVINVTVTGNSAAAQVQGAVGTEYLTNINGRWLVSGGQIHFP